MQHISQPLSPLGNTTSRVLDFIRTYMASHPYAPLLEEIATGCDLASRSVAKYHITQLEKRGLLRRGPLGAHRAIALTEESA